MKTYTILFVVLFVAMVTLGCGGFTDIVQRAEKIDIITPSDTIISETRDVSDFSGIDMQTFGRVIISQGDSESLTVEGSDNVVPLISTKVVNGTLVIDTTKNFNILNMNEYKVLTFTIVVKDLSNLSVSGAGKIEMDRLSTSRFSLDMSGAGELTLDELSAEQLDVNLSGAGSIEISGQVTKATIEIPGAGSVNAGDLECQTATVDISGLGGATVWVTDQLNGSISGAGSVSYYGNPQTQTSTSGLGRYNSLGDK
jgi:hypothetical protein